MITRVEFHREASESRILFRSHEKFILLLCLKITQNVFRKFKNFPQLDLLYLGIQIVKFVIFMLFLTICTRKIVSKLNTLKVDSKKKGK